MALGNDRSPGVLNRIPYARLGADANSAALRATLSELDEPVFEGVIAAHSASTGSRSAPLSLVCLLPLSFSVWGTVCTALKALAGRPWP